MSNIDKRALREVAERATPGNWRRTSSLFNGITVTPFSLCGEEVTLAHTVEKRDAEFIAAANPRTMLALLDENIQLQREKDAIEAVALALRDDMRQAREQLEAAERSIAELERSETQLINERDSAESALSDAYKAVMGQAPEWSNWFSFENAIDEIELACELWRNQTDDVIQFRQRIQELEREKPLMVDAMHAAVALNSAGINLNDFDNCVSRLHEWGAFPDYCVALYLDYIHDVVSENKLLDFGYISDNGTFSTRQRIAELEARTVTPPKNNVANVGDSRWMWYQRDLMWIEAIRAAGIKVKVNDCE